jgi:hypothetical protein
MMKLPIPRLRADRDTTIPAKYKARISSAGHQGDRDGPKLKKPVAWPQS